MTADETMGKWLPDWRDPASYAYTQHLMHEGWAWEFLRRNAAYASFAAHDAGAVDDGLAVVSVDRALDPRDTSYAVAAWELRFLRSRSVGPATLPSVF